MRFSIDRYQYNPIGVSTHINKTIIAEAGIDKTLLAEAGIDNMLLAEAGIDNTLLAQAGIDPYHNRFKPVWIIQYGGYMDTFESSSVWTVWVVLERVSSSGGRRTSSCHAPK